MNPLHIYFDFFIALYRYIPRVALDKVSGLQAILEEDVHAGYCPTFMIFSQQSQHSNFLFVLFSSRRISICSSPVP